MLQQTLYHQNPSPFQIAVKESYLYTYTFNPSNAYPLEIVGRVSETQYQVGNNLNHITQQSQNICITFAQC